LNIAVVYKSKYGAAKQYAEWIAEELGCPCFDRRRINLNELSDYDFVIYGGGLYAGSIAGVKPVIRGFKKPMAVFTCGMTFPLESETVKLAASNFPAADIESGRIKFFHFRGRVEFNKLSPIHKLIMKLVRKAMETDPAATDADRAALKKDVLDFVDREAIAPLLEYARQVVSGE